VRQRSRRSASGGESARGLSLSGMDAACPPKPRTVLVVEDDDVTRAFLLDNLAADGFRVAGASGAGEGLRAIEVRQPALVVLDLLLDDGSGLALLDRVRAADGLSSRIDPDVPVIVLSGRAGDADRVRGFARGADDYVTKPSCRFRQRGIPLVERASSPVGVFDRDVLVRGRKRSDVRAATVCRLPPHDWLGLVAKPVASASARSAASAWSTSSRRHGACRRG
jgi:CheY-like chemotaxis protein